MLSINDVKLGKPAPDLFLEASTRQKISPENCLVFEDAEAGFQAARNANMKFININTFLEVSGENEFGGMSKAKAVI